MLGIRKSPFRRDEDPKLFMIEAVSREADRVGGSLTEAEKKLLASETAPGLVISRETDARLRELVHRIVQREGESREWERDSRCFTAAIKWAGDQEHPYVVQLATEAIALRAGSLPPREKWKDLLSLVLAALGLIVVLVAAIVVSKVIQR